MSYIMQNEKKTSGLLLGKAQTTDRAMSVADFFKKCPYCATATSTGNSVLAVLVFPASQKWWFESIAKDPAGTVGLEEAEIFYPAKVDAVSPWSSGRLVSDQPKPPCGADCDACSMHLDKCPGCPATRFFIQ